MADQGLCVGLQVTRCPKAWCAQFVALLLAYHYQLHSPQLLHRRGHDVDKDRSTAPVLAWPHNLLIVRVGEPFGVRIQRNPLPACPDALLANAHQAIASQPSCDLEAALPGGLPDALGAVPPIEQDVGHGIGNWLEL